MKSNISIRVREMEEGSRFEVTGRGVMQIAVLVETMRREGYELLVSRPTVILKMIEGVQCEPFERIWVEVHEEHLGAIMESLTRRKGRVTNILHHESGGVTVEAEIPTRGLVGFETSLVNRTSGQGVMSHLFLEYRPMPVRSSSGEQGLWFRWTRGDRWLTRSILCNSAEAFHRTWRRGLPGASSR